MKNYFVKFFKQKKIIFELVEVVTEVVNQKTTKIVTIILAIIDITLIDVVSEGLSR